MKGFLLLEVRIKSLQFLTIPQKMLGVQLLSGINHKTLNGSMQKETIGIEVKLQYVQSWTKKQYLFMTHPKTDQARVS